MKVKYLRLICNAVSIILRLFAGPSEVETCCASLDSSTREVSGGCFIRKAWSSRVLFVLWIKRQLK